MPRIPYFCELFRKRLQCMRGSEKRRFDIVLLEHFQHTLEPNRCTENAPRNIGGIGTAALAMSIDPIQMYMIRYQRIEFGIFKSPYQPLTASASIP
jgi:hypothetical protein